MTLGRIDQVFDAFDVPGLGFFFEIPFQVGMGDLAEIRFAVRRWLVTGATGKALFKGIKEAFTVEFEVIE